MSKIFSNLVLKKYFKPYLTHLIQNDKIKPTLHIIQFGDELASTKYVLLKQKVGAKLGVEVIIHKLGVNVPESDIKTILKEIHEQKLTNSKVGLIYQLPVPAKFQHFVDNIDQNLDVDLLGTNAEFLWRKNILPPTIAAVDLVLKHMMKQDFGQEKTSLVNFGKLLDIDLDFKGLKVGVVGQGVLVGTPIVKYLLTRNATIISINKQTEHPQNLTNECDILISATGKVGLINNDWFSKGIIVDVGTSEQNGTLQGDIDSTKMKDSIYLCPSPGGVGPLTVYFIFWNLIRLT